MPGIVGLITKRPRASAEQELLRMVSAISHEPSYVTGTWIDEAMGVYVGWVARKHSFCEGMPLINEQGDVVLVFSGDDYPEPGITSRLKERGHRFNVEGPSYLVHEYEEDSTFPRCVNGRFHGIVADRTRGEVKLFNDRYGLHRVYFHESNDAFYFASEAKAILAVRPELRSADPQGLGELVSCGCVLENRTLFSGIHLLPPGSLWSFANAALVKRGTYFQSKEWEEQEKLDPKAYYEALRNVFERNLPRYFSGPERLGVSLTGGLDSRMIMAWQKSAPQSLPCYSFGGSYRDCHDVRVAREVARACEQPHQVITVAQEFLSNFPRYAERTVYLTDACADVSRSPDLYINERAAAIAPARMTGNYGGEILRGIVAFKPIEPSQGLFQQDFLGRVHAARKTYQGLLRNDSLSFVAFRQVPWHHYGLLCLEQSQMSVRTPYLDNELVQTVFRAPQSVRASNDTCLRLIAEGKPSLYGIMTDRGLAGNHGAVSSAIRRNLLEFTFKAEYAYDYGMPQWLARVDHALAPLHLERQFLGRHKFYHFRVWYRDALAQYIREMLLDPRTLSRPYLNGPALETMVRSHLQGTGNYTLAIHKALTLELLHRQFLD
jgi:asparagine synthase (glutamine-hydrolysing)